MTKNEMLKNLREAKLHAMHELDDWAKKLYLAQHQLDMFQKAYDNQHNYITTLNMLIEETEKDDKGVSVEGNE